MHSRLYLERKIACKPLRGDQSRQVVGNLRFPLDCYLSWMPRITPKPHPVKAHGTLRMLGSFRRSIRPEPLAQRSMAFIGHRGGRPSRIPIGSRESGHTAVRDHASDTVQHLASAARADISLPAGAQGITGFSWPHPASASCRL